MHDEGVTMEEILKWSEKTPKYKPYTLTDSGRASLAQLFFQFKKDKEIKFESYTFRGDRTACADLEEGDFGWVQVLVSSVASARKYNGCPICPRKVEKVGNSWYCETHERVDEMVDHHWITYWGTDGTKVILLSAPCSVSDEINLLGGVWKLTGKMNEDKEFVIRAYAEVDPEDVETDGVDIKFKDKPAAKEKKLTEEEVKPTADIPKERTLSDNDDTFKKDLKSLVQMITTFAKEGMPLERVEAWAAKYRISTDVSEMVEATDEIVQEMTEDSTIIIKPKPVEKKKSE